MSKESFLFSEGGDRENLKKEKIFLSQFILDVRSPAPRVRRVKSRKLWIEGIG